MDKLTSLNPLRHFMTVEGDEIPPGCIEAAFLPSVLHGHGSALALRNEHGSGTVEWFVFSGSIESFLSQLVFVDGIWSLQAGIHSDDPRKVFDLVGYTEKGLKTRTVKGANREHKGWHESLCAAEGVKKNLKLTWKNFGIDLRAEQEQRRIVKTTEEEEEQEEC